MSLLAPSSTDYKRPWTASQRRLRLVRGPTVGVLRVNTHVRRQLQNNQPSATTTANSTLMQAHERKEQRDGTWSVFLTKLLNLSLSSSVSIRWWQRHTCAPATPQRTPRSLAGSRQDNTRTHAMTHARKHARMQTHEQLRTRKHAESGRHSPSSSRSGLGG